MHEPLLGVVVVVDPDVRLRHEEELHGRAPVPDGDPARLLDPALVHLDDVGRGAEPTKDRQLLLGLGPPCLRVDLDLEPAAQALEDLIRSLHRGAEGQDRQHGRQRSDLRQRDPALAERRRARRLGGVDQEGDDLEAAQQRKLRAICEKLDLRPGQRLLDIGCGFGALALHAAEQHGVDVVAISNSRDHVRVARERASHLSSVEVLQLDYRELATLGRFDKVASIEMIEAVGPKNYARYMELVRGCLAPDGAFLLQCFLSPWSVQRCNEWFDRRVFPNDFYLTCLAGVFRGGDLGLVQREQLLPVRSAVGKVCPRDRVDGTNADRAK